MAGVVLGAVAAWMPGRSWGWAVLSLGPHRSLGALLAQKPRRVPRWLPVLGALYSSGEDCTETSAAARGSSVASYAERVRELLRISAFLRFDYSGVGSSDGNLEECTVGKWRKDVLSIIDDLAVGPQILVGSSLGGWLMLHAAIARPGKVMALIGVATAADALVTKFNQLPIEVKKEVELKGVWTLPSKYHEEGAYHIQYSFIKEAEQHCLLHSPIPVTCPIRLLHGMKDDIVPWHTSMQVADRLVSTDVDVILRKHSDHRMKEKADIQLLVYTIDDLIDKLSTTVN
ncbi:Abhydrolase domain-containing protein 10, mitochondrial [Tupaia chinensis]|uniref:Palmitoyl-protein thioesterase ABHD10, mitochondrial n=1 Tax=Tupaia chinensis TaxID=246437 RepID=L9KBH3_TUPCH|nr:Abhydrolase domain-containing protein 10, mitochondrial [Tupaia chinensis]